MAYFKQTTPLEKASFHGIRPGADSLRAADKGAVLVEMAMIVPLLLFFLLCSYEFARALRIHQVAAAITREASREAFRQCFGRKNFSDPANCSEIALTNQCLTGVADDMKTSMRHAKSLGAPFIDHLNVSISAYRLAEATTPAGPVTSAVGAGSATSYTFQPGSGINFPRYNPVTVNASPTLLTFVKNNDYLIITEVLAEYDVTRFGLVPHLLAFRELGHYYYAVFD